MTNNAHSDDSVPQECGLRGERGSVWTCETLACGSCAVKTHGAPLGNHPNICTFTMYFFRKYSFSGKNLTLRPLVEIIRVLH